MAESKNTATDQDEFYDDVTEAFPKVENLAPSIPPNYGDGRLIAVWALGSGQRRGNDGKPYTYVETVTLVLDDGPNGDQANELVGPAPVRLDAFQHSTTGLVARLKPRIDGVNPKNNVKLRYRPAIGRLNTQSSKANKNVPAYSIAVPSDSDRKILEKYRDLIISINKELEAKDAEAADNEAFDS